MDLHTPCSPSPLFNVDYICTSAEELLWCFLDGGIQKEGLLLFAFNLDIRYSTGIYYVI